MSRRGGSAPSGRRRSRDGRKMRRRWPWWFLWRCSRGVRNADAGMVSPPRRGGASGAGGGGERVGEGELWASRRQWLRYLYWLTMMPIPSLCAVGSETDRPDRPKPIFFCFKHVNFLLPPIHNSYHSFSSNLFLSWFWFMFHRSSSY
jgi:hypothetical protein